MINLGNAERRIIISIQSCEQYINYSELEINQEMLNHSTFKFIWRTSISTITNPETDLEFFDKYLDREVTFNMYTLQGKEAYHKGLIKEIKMISIGDDTFSEYIISGTSHTIACEDLEYSRIHLKKDLKTIFKDSLKYHIMGLYEPQDLNPSHKETIPSTMQSHENDWQFLTRLAKQYGEILFWNGTGLQLGTTNNTNINLINGVNLKEFKSSARLLSNKSSISSYDHEKGKQTKSELEHSKDHYTDDLLNSAIIAQKRQYIRKIATEIPYHNYNPLATNQAEANRMTQIDTASKAAKMITYSGISKEAFNIGETMKVQNKTTNHHILIIKSTIKSNGMGHLENHFQAIPADCFYPPYTDINARGFAYDQTARVIDNNDPKGMGRIRVAHYWSETKRNNETDWIRVETPYAGAERGFYCIPEIGDEVRVCFEGNHPDKPYVSGVNYNGQKISGYATPNNDLKVMRTRSGIKTIYNDANGSLTLQDAAGNKCILDGKDTINLEAIKEINLKAGQNINIQAGQNIKMTALQDISETAGNDITQKAAENYNLMATNIMEVAKQDKNSNADDIEENAINYNTNSEKEANINAKQTLHKNNNKQANLN